MIDFRLIFGVREMQSGWYLLSHRNRPSNKHFNINQCKRLQTTVYYCCCSFLQTSKLMSVMCFVIKIKNEINEHFRWIDVTVIMIEHSNSSLDERTLFAININAWMESVEFFLVSWFDQKKEKTFNSKLS